MSGIGQLKAKKVKISRGKSFARYKMYPLGVQNVPKVVLANECQGKNIGKVGKKSENPGEKVLK